MSDADNSADGMVQPLREPDSRAAPGRAVEVARRVGRFLFGDRKGLALFLGAVLWLTALWRIGIFIQDTVAVASALANVASGRLALVDLPYSLTIGPQPGVVEVGGQTFGRNYGHVLLALPVLLLLKGLKWLAAPKLLLAGAWSLGLVALAGQVATVTGRKHVRTLGSGVAVLLFAGNVAAAKALPDGILALVALQLTTILVGAYIAVVLYRLVGRFHGSRVGVAAGIAVMVASPIGFWASIPKRHVVTAGAAVLALYLFAVSREGTDSNQVLARAGAYATLGLLTTVHPFEAFFLFVVLVVVDLATAPTNSPRALGAVALVFACSMLPFFILNTLISGNPLQSPRMIGGYENLVPSTGTGDGGAPAPSNGGGSPPSSGGGSGPTPSTGGGSGSTPGTGGGSGLIPETGPLSTVVGTVTATLDFTWSLAAFATGWVTGGLAVLSDPEQLSNIFFRSGGMPGVLTPLNDYEAIELTLLESFPLLAAVVWLPVGAVQTLRARARGAGLSTPRRQTDLLAAGFVVVFTLIYLTKLPLHSQITVRYILPIVPLLVYGLARLSFVRRVVEERPRWLVGEYLATVVVGGVGVSLATATLDPAIGEAMQLHALVALGAAALAVVAIASWPVHRETRLLAVGLAVPAGVTTVFLLFAKVQYFSYRLPGDFSPHVFALDLIRLIAEILPG